MLGAFDRSFAIASGTWRGPLAVPGSLLAFEQFYYLVALLGLGAIKAVRFDFEAESAAILLRIS